MFFPTNPIPSRISRGLACLFLLVMSLAALTAWGLPDSGGSPATTLTSPASKATAETAPARRSPTQAEVRAIVGVWRTVISAALGGYLRPIGVVVDWLLAVSPVLATGVTIEVPETPPANAAVRRDSPAVHRLPGTNPPPS